MPKYSPHHFFCFLGYSAPHRAIIFCRARHARCQTTVPRKLLYFQCLRTILLFQHAPRQTKSLRELLRLECRCALCQKLISGRLLYVWCQRELCNQWFSGRCFCFFCVSAHSAKEMTDSCRIVGARAHSAKPWFL